ncbi:ABC transporter substrate-binding protein [bacterium]|nr:ABC transporter substrate-binding protein [bacterium]
MKKQMIGFFVIGAFLLMLPWVGVAEGGEDSRVIVDLAGRQVRIPSKVKRVATFVGPSYDKTFMLGDAENVVLLSFSQLPWAQRLNPGLKIVPTTESYKDPNIEDILQAGVDVLFYWSWSKPVKKMSDSGIPVICALGSSTKPHTIDEFVLSVKNEVRLYGEVLGKEAQQRAREYSDYFDEKVNRVLSVTTKIPDSKKPKVYYVRGPDVLTTHGSGSNTQWYVEMAGGNLITKDTKIKNFGKVSIEQVLVWDPDIIMMGRLNSTDAIINSPKWKTITAVKKNQVYVNPQGHFYWDYGSEGALFLLYLAKTFHPEQFSDIDMVQELKFFYGKFFRYQLADDEAHRILQHLPPEESD